MRQVLILFALTLSIGIHAQFDTDQVVPDFIRKDTTKIATYYNSYGTDMAGTFVSSYIFSEVDQNNYDMLTANIKFTDKDQTIKFTVAPLRFTRPSQSTGLQILKENFKIQITQTKTNTIGGASIGYDNTSPWSKRAQNFRKEFFTVPAWDGSDKTKDAYLDSLKTRKAMYNLALYKNQFRFNTGYSDKLFALMKSTQIHPDSAAPYADTAAYYIEKSKTISLSAAYTRSTMKLGFSVIASGYYMLSRPNSQKVLGKEMIPYNGFTISGNVRIFKFMDWNRLKFNENYLKTGFIPALYIGATYDYLGTNVANDKYMYIEDGVKKKTALTFNLDVCISPALQFRIGVPYVVSDKVDGKKSKDVGATIQYTLKFSNLAE
jgi:hypothetical protein